MPGEILVRPITASRFRDVEQLFLTDSIMRWCWDIWPRYDTRERRVLQAKLAPRATRGGRRPPPSTAATNRELLRKLAARRRAPGLLAYLDSQPVGFLSLGPRTEMHRIDRSRTSPRVDDVPVWVVPCFFVHNKYRGRGITVALLQAAVEYAGKHGAPAVEGYPRAPGARVDDSTAFFGSVAQFRRAGYRVVARPRRDLPKGWVPRYAMRAECS